MADKLTDKLMNKCFKLLTFLCVSVGPLGLTLMTSSCVTAGKDFKSETVWIRAGETKQADVRLVLGDPRSVGTSSGMATWTYGFYRYFLIGDSYTKELKIYWRPDGLVNHYSFTSSFPEDRRQGAGQKQGGKVPAHGETEF